MILSSLFYNAWLHSILSNDVTRRGRSKINRSAYTGPTHAVAW
jgi:hypothetical protein